MNQLPDISLLQGGIILGLVATIMSSLKSIPKVLYDIIHRKIVYKINVSDVDRLYGEFEDWLAHNHHRQYRNVQVSHSGETHKLIIKQHQDAFYIKYKNRWIHINKNREKFEHASDITKAFFNHYSISGILAKEQITNLMEEVILFAGRSKDQSQTVDLYDYGWGHEYTGRILAKDMDNVFFKDKNTMMADINTYLNNEQWYLNRGIRYKRGYLLYGEPGNGKSTIAAAIAKHLGRNLYTIDLNRITDKDLKKAFLSLPKRSILLLEDIDCAFTKRDNNKGDFSFSTLLNCLDGVYAPHDVIIIITTNHKEALDPALLRSGRVDMKIYMGNPEIEHINAYVSGFYKNDFSDVFCDVSQNTKFCMADIQSICLDNENNADTTIATIMEGICTKTITQNGN